MSTATHTHTVYLEGSDTIQQFCPQRTPDFDPWNYKARDGCFLSCVMDEASCPELGTSLRLELETDSYHEP
jgi:hypothetical protein